MRRERRAGKRPGRAAPPSAPLCATPPMLPEQQLQEGPRPGSTATNAPGDRKLESKSQPNLQYTSTCEILASPISQTTCEKEERLARPPLESRIPCISVAEILPYCPLVKL